MSEIDAEVTPREDLYRTIQQHAGNSELTSAPEDAVLLGFVIIAEWESPDGDRWISKLSGDAFRTLPPWRERGMCAEVVHGEWNEVSDDDDGD